MTQAEAQQALAECRRKIDAIDLQLRDLLNQRTQIVIDVLKMKDYLGLPIHEPNREEHVLQKITEGNSGPLSDPALRRLYGLLMQEMRTFQQDRRQRENPAEREGPGAAEREGPGAAEREGPGE